MIRNTLMEVSINIAKVKVSTIVVGDNRRSVVLV